LPLQPIDMAIVEEYLNSILKLVETKNSKELQSYLRVEPDPQLPDSFAQLSQELKTSYFDSKILEQQITDLLPTREDEDRPEDGNIWPGFLAFIQEYLEYWRDVNFADLLETHLQLSNLTKYVSFLTTSIDGN
jgi:hypothetical protein